MKKVIQVLLLMFFIQPVWSQNAKLNMTKLGGWADALTGTYYNDIWGYSADGREYAIMGSNHSTYFLDITDNTPVLISSFQGNDLDVVWRDYKVYKHYAYGVADGGDNTLQIFDLSDLPNSVTKIYDNNTFSESTHNIFIDNDRLYLASNRRMGAQYALEVLSLEDPENPIYLGYVPSSNFGGNAIHDVYVKNDTAYCSAEYSGLYIMNLSNMNNPINISSITTYPDQGYNHSSWVSEDGKTLVMADEVPNSLALKLYDISDITDPVYLTKFVSNVGARPHNPFFKQNKIIISYYFDGVQIFDVTNPSEPIQTAFYDTYPDNDTITGDIYPDEFNGCWGVFPFFESGKIIANDITYGLFVLETPEIKSTLNTSEPFVNKIEIYPNPAQKTILIRAKDLVKDLEIRNALGQNTLQMNGLNSSLVNLDISNLSNGVYTVILSTNNSTIVEKIIIRH